MVSNVIHNNYVAKSKNSAALDYCLNFIAFFLPKGDAKLKPKQPP